MGGTPPLSKGSSRGPCRPGRPIPVCRHLPSSVSGETVPATKTVEEFYSDQIISATPTLCVKDLTASKTIKPKV